MNKDIIELSRRYGRDKEYVIAGGGNTSYKDKDRLWIKSSGIALANIDETGFVCLSREKLKGIRKKKYSDNVLMREEEVKNDLNNAIVSGDGNRPSVETSLHELINFSFVIHTHPTLVNALMCSLNARKTTKELFGSKVLYIEYTDPGYILFKKIDLELTSFREQNGYDPQIILLENHGVFVNANTSQEIIDLYSEIETKIKNRLISNISPIIISKFRSEIIPAILTQYPKATKAKPINCNLIQKYVQDKASFEIIATAYTPDHIVYCKSRYLFIDDDREEQVLRLLNDFKKRHKYFPQVIGIEKKGLVMLNTDKKGIEIIQDLILNMLKIAYLADSFGGAKSLTETQIEFIENWEAENYRKKISEK